MSEAGVEEAKKESKALKNKRKAAKKKQQKINNQIKRVNKLETIGWSEVCNQITKFYQDDPVNRKLRKNKALISSASPQSIDEKILITKEFYRCGFQIRKSNGVYKAFKTVSNKEKKYSSHVYIIREKDTDCLKIGISTSVKKRLKSLQTSNPRTLYLSSTFVPSRGRSVAALEKALHKQFSQKRLRGEWFSNITDDEIKLYVKHY